MDRTNWQYGKTDINILTIGIVRNGIAIPILWTLLDKRGCSDTEERKNLIKKFVDIFGKGSIEMLLADREFIGQQRIGRLLEQKIPFVIRISSHSKSKRK